MTWPNMAHFIRPQYHDSREDFLVRTDDQKYLGDLKTILLGGGHPRYGNTLREKPVSIKYIEKVN